MIDWMIQVFRVMKKSSDETYFLAVSLIDRYLEVYEKTHNYKITLDKFHLVGICCVFMASKYVDTIPISM